MRVCSSKQSKYRSACNSLLITVILPQLCSASIVIALLFWKTRRGEGRSDRTGSWRADNRRWRFADKMNRHFADSISSRLSSLSIRPWADFIDYLFHVLSHILTLPVLSLCNRDSLSLSVTFTHADTYPQSFHYFTQLLSLFPLLIHTCMHNLLMLINPVFAYNINTHTLRVLL